MAKVLVSMDDRLLARVDREARRAGLSRSAYLARVASQAVGDRTGPGREARVGRALARLDAVFEDRWGTEEATAAVRSERDAR